MTFARRPSHELTVARVVDIGRVNMQTDPLGKTYSWDWPFLHVPTVVLYCVLMSGRRGKFQKDKKPTKTRPFFLHDTSRVVIVR